MQVKTETTLTVVMDSDEAEIISAALAVAERSTKMWINGATITPEEQSKMRQMRGEINSRMSD